MMPPTVSYARNVRKLVSQTRQDKKQIKAQDIPGLCSGIGRCYGQHAELASMRQVGSGRGGTGDTVTAWQ